MIVGLDFDNTIVEYTALFRDVAVENRWLEASSSARSKKDVRDMVRLLPDGEMKWRDLQAAVYGPRILEAPPFPGVKDFLVECRKSRREVHVISHKTQYAANDASKTCNLREMALAWFDHNGFFGDETGLKSDKVHFADTRIDKVALIDRLSCRAFVDDLVETFEEPGFPSGVTQILFADGRSAFEGLVANDWKEVGRLVEEAFSGNR